MIIDTLNHKGQRCPYKDLFCQEGYCVGCHIYKDWYKGGKSVK